MYITIHEALELDVFKGFKIIAGNKGLSNKITNVGILDYEIDALIDKNFKEGEFVLSNLMLIKDNIEELYDMVQRMISIKVSGLAIKTVFIDSIPDEVIKLADENYFPVMLFKDTFIENIITEVAKAMEEKSENNNLSMKIDNILYGNLDSLVIKRIGHEINRNFKENNIVAFCKVKDSKQSSMRKKIFYKDNYRSLDQLIPYKEGYIFINTYSDVKTVNVRNIVMQRLEEYGISEKYYTIGISNLHNSLEELKYSIMESMYANKYSAAYSKDISHFDEIGINKILIPLMDNPWVLKYYNEIIEPLIQYDEKNDTEFLKTAIKYVENNGDMKATARDLYQHGNTIRYRIERINNILNNNTSMKHFYEELAVAVRIYNLFKM